LAIAADLDADAAALGLAAGLRAGALRAGALRAGGAFLFVVFLVAAIKESPGCVCVSAAQNQTTVAALQAHNDPVRKRISWQAAFADRAHAFAAPIAVSKGRIAVVAARDPVSVPVRRALARCAGIC
jgi:hypothetical protein